MRSERLLTVLACLFALGCSSGDAEDAPDVLNPEDPVDCAALEPDGPTVWQHGEGVAFPGGFSDAYCSPRSSGVGEYRCCSDDPAAVGGLLPRYEGLGDPDGGTPIFADENNERGTSGLCVRTEDIPSLAQAVQGGCPVPCNPTWSEDDVRDVCSGGQTCCQVQELQPADCVQDDDGTWRPVTGHDIAAGLTDWNERAHGTHQDPNGTGCADLVGSADSPEFLSCIEQLSVANQRGLCVALPSGETCPAEAPDYVDPCEQINRGLLQPPR